jgi:hypothetical protein
MRLKVRDWQQCHVDPIYYLLRVYFGMQMILRRHIGKRFARFYGISGVDVLMLS